VTDKRLPKSSEAVMVEKEALVQEIIAVLTRTWTAAEAPGSAQQLEEFFRKLDANTLRAIAYQHGIYEPELDVDDEESGAPPKE
jgi:hypothetical protein